ncbi:hypothetical protein [Frankia sp. KB5]|uniref:hypothetical protein n=1 Tax=Frankia sp. KB5 TaxID=683318 RepID=UPI001F52C9EE|nr:hypothetical protein [Frankia sp. KB5]
MAAAASTLRTYGYWRADASEADRRGSSQDNRQATPRTKGTIRAGNRACQAGVLNSTPWEQQGWTPNGKQAVVTHEDMPDSPRRNGSSRRLGWRRRHPAPVPEAPATVIVDGIPVITVAPADFVCCSYKGCGTLRPLAEAVENRPCPGCGRV